MADFRALCAELLGALTTTNPSAFGKFAALEDRARAALAEPVPDHPTDDELLELMSKQMRDDLTFMTRKTVEHGAPAGLYRVIVNTHIADLCRAVLSRWGNHPAP